MQTDHYYENKNDTYSNATQTIITLYKGKQIYYKAGKNKVEIDTPISVLTIMEEF